MKKKKNIEGIMFPILFMLCNRNYKFSKKIESVSLNHNLTTVFFMYVTYLFIKIQVFSHGFVTIKKNVFLFITTVKHVYDGKFVLIPVSPKKSILNK